MERGGSQHISPASSLRIWVEDDATNPSSKCQPCFPWWWWVWVGAEADSFDFKHVELFSMSLLGWGRNPDCCHVYPAIKFLRVMTFPPCLHVSGPRFPNMHGDLVFALFVFIVITIR